MVQQYVAEVAVMVNSNEYDDVTAIELIFNYAYTIANSNFDNALTLIASAFYRNAVGWFGDAENYLYTDLHLGAEFGVSGFHEVFVGAEEGNSNQLEHFFGEAYIFNELYLSAGVGSATAYLYELKDIGRVPEEIRKADYLLGKLAAQWVSDPTSMSITDVTDIIRAGDYE